jgi:hypothetical protein
MSTTRRGRRPLARAGALAAAATLLLAACGNGEDGVSTSPGAPAPGGSVTSTPDPSATRSPAPSATDGTPDATGRTELTIVLDDGSGTSRTWRLTCDPAGGDHPDPAAACKALAEHGETALPPVPKDRMCTQIFGGPEKATVTGTWRGKPVNASFSKNNGCEISRWRSLNGLLPAIGGPGS